MNKLVDALRRGEGFGKGLRVKPVEGREGVREMTLTPEQRALRGKLAAYTSWANTTDRTARTRAGTDAFMVRFARLVDPDNQLAPEVRKQRAESAMRAHMARLALKSSQARSKNKG